LTGVKKHLKLSASKVTTSKALPVKRRGFCFSACRIASPGRTAKVITYHKRFGEVSRLTISNKVLEAA
jgi:hypothetical protein